MKSLLRRRAGRPSAAVPPARPDLIAESRAREAAACAAIAAVHSDPLRRIAGPRHPDVLVFGTWHPPGDGGWPERRCGLHLVRWTGDRPCWMCVPDTAVTR